MTRASMLALLRGLSGVEFSDEDGINAHCAECCREVDEKKLPRHWPDCKLAAAIAWLEDENNSEVHYEYDDKPATRMWVLR